VVRGYEAILPEVLALLQRETGEQCYGRYRISTGRREFPSSIFVTFPYRHVSEYACGLAGDTS
jgi:hypothetical protein